MNIFLKLWKLQEIEDKIRIYVGEQKRFEQMKEITVAYKKVVETKRIIEAYQQIKQDIQERYKQKNSVILDLDQEIKKLEEELYQGAGQNSKQALQIQNRINQLLKKREILEEEGINYLVELEEKEEEIKNIIDTLQKKIVDYNKMKIEREENLSIISTQLENLKKLKEKAKKDLPDTLLQQFEFLLNNKQGKAVVIIRSGVCQGCHMGLSTSFIQKINNPDTIIYCEFCQRIIGKQDWIEEGSLNIDNYQ